MTSLSVIVPAFNAERTLRESLNSIREDLPSDAELILVNDCSFDKTSQIAEEYCDRVINQDKNQGDGAARIAGIRVAKGDVLLFIDSDVVIPRGSCARVISAFESDPMLAAVTGRLSTIPQPGFFTDYKNIYMNFTFGCLPDDITFLYGSIFAIRANHARTVDDIFRRIGADTALGQDLARRGHKVKLLRDLEVVHLKRHTVFSFYRNDFMIPYGWARLFRKFQGWRQLGRHGTGFAHSPKGQLSSLGLAWATVLIALGAALEYCSPALSALSFIGWAGLNARFHFFIFSRRGIGYTIKSIPVTFFDHIVMALGATLGLIDAYTKDFDEL